MRGHLTLALLLTFLGWGSGALAQDTEEMLRDGIALHDQGEFEQAAEKFVAILEFFPENALAAYELALTYAASQKFERCIEVANSSIAISEQVNTDPALVGGLYLMLASCHSELGELDRAVEVFDAGIKQFPDNYDLHFNKAVSQGRRGLFDDALAHLHSALQIDPAQASPYYLLGANYAERGQDVLAILSYLSFLQMEFNTNRCVVASRHIFEIIFARVQPGADGAINVSVDPDADESFAGLTGLDFALSTAAAAHSSPDGVKEPVADSMTETLSIFVKMTSQLDFDGDPETVIGKYLLPGAQRLNEAAIPGAFAWYVAFMAGVPGTDDWPQSGDADDVSEYLNHLAAQ